MSDILSLFPLPLFLLCFLYLVLFIMSLQKIKYFSFDYHKGFLGKFFYISICIQTLSRVILFFLLAILLILKYKESDSRSALSNFFVNIVYIPEILLWVSLTILFWQYVILFYISHINFSNTEHQNNWPVPLRRRTFSLFIIIIISYFIIQGIIIILYDEVILSFNTFLLEDVIINYCIPVFYLISQLILHLKFSGAPYLSKIFSEKKRKMVKVLAFWVFTRLFQASFSLAILLSEDYIIYNNFLTNDETKPDSEKVLVIVVFFIDHFICELIPYAIALDKDIILIFNLNISENSLNDLNKLILDESSNPFVDQNKLLSNENENDILEASLKNFDLTKIIYNDREISGNSKSHNKLGIIKKAQYFSKSLAVRVINLKEMSHFIIDEIKEDIARLLRLNWSIILPVKAFNSADSELLLISDWLEYDSLEVYLQKNKISVEEINKNDENNYKIAYEIAKSLQYMHENQIIHGHLTPSNIFINKELNALITDCLFFGVKKICSLKNNYVNKSKYSAPELLKEKSKIIKNPGKSADVYSFGIMLFEIFERKPSFNNISSKDLIDFVVQKQSRPKISNETHPEISQLIRACWQDENEKRPDFPLITHILSKFVE